MVTNGPTTTDLAAEIAALRARLDAQAAPPRRGRKRPTATGRLRAIAAASLLAALIPLGIMAAAPTLTDLNDAATDHRSDIQTIANAGVTTGFDDPNSTNPNDRVYYPKDLVTREQIASYLARLGGLNGYPAIVNAASVAPGGVTASSISSSGSTAGQVLTSNGTTVSWQNPMGAPGPVGPPGPTGPPGPPGQPGTSSNGLAVSTGEGPNSILVPVPSAGGILDLVSSPFVAPSAGYVQVTVLVAYQLSPMPVRTTVSARLQNSTTGANSPFVADPLDLNEPEPQPFTMAWTFPVNAGENTFSMRVSANADGTFITQAHINIIFVPGPAAP